MRRTKTPHYPETVQTIHHSLIAAYQKDAKKITEYFAKNPEAIKFQKLKDGIDDPICSVIKDPATGRLLLLANENLAPTEAEKVGKRFIARTKKYGDVGAGWARPVKYALDIETQQLCVVKKIMGGNEKAAYEQELSMARTVGITQPGFDAPIVRTDESRTQEKHYIVLKYLGTTLRDVLEPEKIANLAHSQILEIFILIFQKIQKLHNQGYVHGDLKIDNITVQFDLSGHIIDVHLIDFELTKNFLPETNSVDYIRAMHGMMPAIRLLNLPDITLKKLMEGYSRGDIAVIKQLRDLQATLLSQTAAVEDANISHRGKESSHHATFFQPVQPVKRTVAELKEKYKEESILSKVINNIFKEGQTYEGAISEMKSRLKRDKDGNVITSGASYKTLQYAGELPYYDQPSVGSFRVKNS